MDNKKYDFRNIGTNETEMIKELFSDVFMSEPWNDDWSDSEQLDLYLSDLIDQNNSLTYGLFENGKLIGVSMGHIKHWYSGTEYYVDELCVARHLQGKGIGSRFLEAVEAWLSENGIRQIFLQTEHNVPAYQFYLNHGFHELQGHVSFAKQICR